MNSHIPNSGGWARPLVSILAGLILAAILMQLSGYDVRAAYGALWSGATGLESGHARGTSQIALGPLNAHVNLYQLAQSLSRVTPLLLAGLAIALALRAGLFNIGAQGQMTVGALAAAVVGTWGASGKGSAGHSSLPPFLHIFLVLLAGAVAGGLWGALPGLLKAYRGVHEVISTIMLNYLGLNIVTYLVTHNLKDPKSQATQTALISPSAMLSPWVAGSNLTFGFVVAIVCAGVVTFLIRRSSLGYQIRAVGLGSEASRAAGIPVVRVLVTTMSLSGGLAGIAGAIEVMGIHHRYVQGVAGNYGFDGIAVALLGGLGGLAVTLSAFFFGFLAAGADYMETLTNVPNSVALIVQALVILFVGIRAVRKASRRDASPAVTTPPQEGSTTPNAAI